MTQQEVIKAFMKRLANHGYSVSNATAENMLNSAVTASSRYTDIQSVIDSMKADQATCEVNAIQTVVIGVLGVNWYLENCVNYLTDNQGNYITDADGYPQIESFKTLSEIETALDSTTKSDGTAVTYEDVKNFTAADTYSSLSNVIKELTANTFLTEYCGIQLEENYFIDSDGIIDFNDTTGNTDTGAITGSDAGGANVKNADDIVPETWINTYTATTNQGQKISTGSRDWVVKATAADDTITSGGADSINAGAGDDKINITADGATVTSGVGNDQISISADVKKVTISDLNAEDTLTIAGSFEVGAAKIEDMQLVIMDKTGTRKITLGDLENAQNGNINIGGASTTIAEWLTNSGIDLNNLEETTYAESIEVTPAKTSATAPTEKTVSTHDVTNAVDINLDDYLTADEGNVNKNGEVVGELSSSFPNASTFTRNGLTIHLLGTSSDSNPDNITAKNFDELTADQKAVVGALFKWWGSETLKLNEESYGIGFNSSTAQVSDIGLYFYSSANFTLASFGNWSNMTTDGEAYKLMFNINMNYYGGISSNNNNEAVMNGKSRSSYLDRTLAHEMTHAVMAVNVNYIDNFPGFIMEGMAELTHGIDDESSESIFQIAYDAEELAASLVIQPGTGFQEEGNLYAGGYMFMRYFAKQAALQTSVNPAFGEITANVNFGSLKNLAAGNVLYIDTAQKNPTVQVAADYDEFYNVPDKNGTLVNIGEIGIDAEGSLYYQVSSDLFKQNITTGGKISDVYGVNANAKVTGTSGYDGVEIVEGSTEINTGGGDDFVMVSGQYATISTGANDDTVKIFEGSHNEINLGEGDNYLQIEGKPILNSDETSLYSEIYGNTITGGAGADTVNNGLRLAAVDDNGNTYLDHQVGYYEDANNAYYYAFDNEGNPVIVAPLDFYLQNYNSQIDLGNGENQVALYYLKDSELTTGKDADLIQIDYLEKSNINAGGGNDNIIFYGKEISIDGGAGNDTVTGNGENVTINVADGDDLIKVIDTTKTSDLTVKEFGAGDVLEVTENISLDDIEEVEGGIKINNTVINGVYKSQVEEIWDTLDGGFKYSKTADTLTQNELQFSYTETKDNFNITNLADGVTLAQIQSAVSVEDATITITDETILDKTKTVTAPEGYTLALGDDITKSETETLAWKVSGTTATLRTDTSAGYKVENNELTYSDSVAGASQMELSGVVKNAEIAAPENQIVTIDASALNKNSAIVSNAENYSVKLTGDMTDKTFSGNDEKAAIEVAANNAIINGGADDDSIAINGAANVTIDGGAGADTISLNGSNSLLIFKSDSDNDIVYGYKSTDVIKMFGSNYTKNESGNDILLEIGNSKMTLKDAKGTDLNIDNVRMPDTFQTGIIMRNSILTASSAFEDSEIDLGEYPANIAKLNAAAVTQDLKITATENITSIISGKGDDTLNGGSGNITLRGGTGKDIFVYESGNDFIADYNAEDDKIHLDSGKVTKTTLSGSNAILTTDEGTLTIKNAKNKIITFVDDSGAETQRIFYADTSYAPLEEGLSYNSTKNKLTADKNFGGNEIDLANYLSTVETVNAGAVTKDLKIVGNANANLINGGTANDIIQSGAGNNIVRGGTGTDSITCGADNDKLYGEDGNDTINGGTGTNTLYGGAGADVFIYGGGKDFIADYNADEDIIQLDFSKVTKTTLSGSNAILTTDEGTLTIKNAKNKIITFVDDSGAETQRIFYADTSYAPLEEGLSYNSTKNKLTADKNFDGNEIDLANYLSTVEKVDTSANTSMLKIVATEKAVSIKGGTSDDEISGNAGNDTLKGGNGGDNILGNAGDDKIYGEGGDDVLNGGVGNDKIYGDAGDDILYGGTGNDTLTGSAGTDIFVYEGGKDFIEDYAAGEEIRLSSGTISDYSYSGKNLVFKIGNETLTVKNAKGKEITVTDSNNKTTTEIYPTVKANAQTYELLYDNNFATDEFGIDEITEQKFEVQNIETQNNLELSQPVITYGEDKEK